MEHEEGSHRNMAIVKRLGLVGIVCCGSILSGCIGTVPTHETPGWDELIAEVQRELATIEPDPVDSTDPDENLTRSSPNAVESNLKDVKVGQCLLYPYDDDGDLMDVVQVVPCEEPHYGEVYTTGEFTDDEYSASFDGIVAAACEEEFESYVGIDYWSSVLYYDYSYVSQVGWEMGLRGWRCYAVESDHENSGSVRLSGR